MAAAVLFLDSEFRRKRRLKQISKYKVNIKDSEDKCRICLTKDLKNVGLPYHSIFKSNTDHTIAKKIRKFGDVQISKEDGLPQVLCQVCYNLLQGAVLFRQQAQASDRKLRDNIQRQRRMKQHHEIIGDTHTPDKKMNKKCLVDTNTEYNEATVSDDNYKERDISKYLQRSCNENTTEIVQTHCNDNDIEVPNSSNPNEAESTERSFNVIEKPKTFKCTKCQNEFSTKEELTEHRKTDRVRVPCPECRVSVACSYMSIHMTSYHAAVQPFICEVCGRGFPGKHILRRHLLLHSDQLPHKCQQCPYRGRFLESLKIHMRFHTGEKPYVCDQCPARFVTASNLNQHKLTHSGHGFKCDVCGRGFYVSSKLKRHMLIDHTGVKEHKCDICGKEFGHRKQMMKHSRKVHNRAKCFNGRLPLYLQQEMKIRQQ